jgi:hypothetical protein
MTFFSQVSKHIVQFVGFSHLIIALGGGASVFVTCFALGICDFKIVLAPAIFIVSCTGLGYSIQRFIKARLFPSSVPIDRLVYLSKYGWGLVLGWAVVFIASLKYVDLKFDSTAWILLGGLGLLGLGYAILPRRLSNIGRSMREIRGVKLPLLSAVWGAATVLLPVALIGGLEIVSIGLLLGVFLSRVLYIAGLTIPFDVRDLDVDHAYMKTLPQSIGVKRSLNVAMMLVGMSSGVWLLMGTMGVMDMRLAIALAIHGLLTVVLVSPRNTGVKRHEYYYSIILDGMLVLQIASLGAVLS